VIDLGFMQGKDVAVLGLGRTGFAAARALLAAGARVAAWDDGEATRDKAAAAGIPLAPPSSADWQRVSSLVLSPGIPHSFPRPHAAVVAARRQGIPVIGDIELFALAVAGTPTIGVTGTNGKSTTTALIGHIFSQAGRDVGIGGNLGRAVLDLDPLGDGGVYVIELSSFQLELIVSAAYDVAVLINISPDHLDRHGDMAGYVAAKTRIFANQAPRMAAVVGVDDAESRRLYRDLSRRGGRRLIPISARRAVAGGCYVKGGLLHDDLTGKARPVADLRRAPALPGVHNHQNAAAAYAASRAAGLRPEVIVRGLYSYPGLPHRQERVATIDGVLYVNDSKATNPDAALRALACYRDIYWIAGGRAKDAALRLSAGIARRVRRAFLIGEAAAAFAETLGPAVPVVRAGTLAAAVAAARAAALAEGRPSPVVLLSPACASYDQFRDFEQRGDSFRDLVAALSRAGAEGRAA